MSEIIAHFLLDFCFDQCVERGKYPIIVAMRRYTKLHSIALNVKYSCFVLSTNKRFGDFRLSIDGHKASFVLTVRLVYAHTQLPPFYLLIILN